MLERVFTIPPRGHLSWINNIKYQDEVEKDTNNAVHRKCQLVQKHYPFVRRKRFSFCNFLGVVSIGNVAFVFIDFKLKLTESSGISNLGKCHYCKQQSCE